MAFVIRLRKESFKFSGSHFTIFSETSAERLHGHNYYVGVDLFVPEISAETGMAFDFNDIKPTIKHLCDGLDEMVLIPKNSPYLKLDTKKGEIEVHFAKKRYVFPEDDTVMLPITNVSSEELARYLARQLKNELKKAFPITALAVTVKETQGQGVTYKLKL